MIDAIMEIAEEYDGLVPTRVARQAGISAASLVKPANPAGSCAAYRIPPGRGIAAAANGFGSVVSHENAFAPARMRLPIV